MNKLVIALFISCGCVLAQSSGPSVGSPINSINVVVDPSGSCSTYQQKQINVTVTPPREWLCVNTAPLVNAFGTWTHSNAGGGAAIAMTPNVLAGDNAGNGVSAGFTTGAVSSAITQAGTALQPGVGTTVNGQPCIINASCTITAVPAGLPASAVLGSTSGGGAVDITGAVKNASGASTLRDFISLGDFIPASSSTYKPARFSSQIQNTTGDVTTTAGSKFIVCPGCNFTSADATSNSRIVIFTLNSITRFESFITAISDSSHATINDNADVNSSTRFAFVGTDATTFIDAAWAAAKAANKCLLIPAISTTGSTGYWYEGDGINGWASPCVYGDNPDMAFVYQGEGKRLVDGNELWTASRFENLTFIGGAGAIRNRYTANNVQGVHQIANNAFLYFTGNAVGFSSPDIPYIHYDHNRCHAVNTTTTTCFANAGSDKGWVKHSTFENQQFGVKLGLAGNAVNIEASDFIQFSGAVGGVVRAPIWLVPNSTYVNINPVTIDNHNKFGNENQSATDLLLLAADSTATSTGIYFGDTQPLTTASTAWIGELNFIGNTITGSLARPLIYSYTPNINDVRMDGIFQGTPPSYAIQFDPVVTPANNYTNVNNICGPFSGNEQYATTGGMLTSNISGYCNGNPDPTNAFSYSDPVTISPGIGGDSGTSSWTPLLSTAINSFTLVGTGSSKNQITDSANGTNAATFTMGTVTGVNTTYIYSPFTTSPTVGVPVFIDADLQNGSTGTSASGILVQIADGSTVVYQAAIPLTASWIQSTFRWVPRTAAVSGYSVRFSNTSNAATAQTVNIGIVKVYAGSRPLGGGQFFPQATISHNDAASVATLSLVNQNSSNRNSGVSWRQNATLLWSLRNDSSVANVQNMSLVDNLNSRYAWSVESDGSFNLSPTNSTTKGPLYWDLNGLAHQNGTAPVASVGTLTGTNAGGKIASLSAATSLTVTFANSGWGTWAACTANTDQAGIVPTSSVTTTVATFTMTALTGTLYYTCVGK